MITKYIWNTRFKQPSRLDGFVLNGEFTEQK